ncbi:MAG: PQQ-dependent sugar dehydrogenase [Fibrobacteria bacterium]
MSFKYGGCSDVGQANFNRVTLVSKAKVAGLEEPVRFSVAKDGRVFFAERNGTISVVLPDGNIVKLGKIPVFDLHAKLTLNEENEFGLDGMVLDRNFETTGWLYAYFQHPTQLLSKLSRFKVTGTTLDLNSEQNVLSWTYQNAYCCHTGGGMEFDAKGDLWLSVGNNTRNPDLTAANGYVDESQEVADDQAHAANTNDLRGKILRIHPLDAPDADGKLYSIPSGNMKEVYASVWGADTAKVRPEIYAMGNRSNYTISVDTVKNLLTWGDIGPDNGYDSEEFNITDKPGFFGWPYFVGAVGNAHYSFRLNKDPAAPVNTSKNNTGSQKLPPAIGATIGYRQSAAIAGSVYRWNTWQTSPKKLPPHFMDKWFHTDMNSGILQVATLAANGIRVEKRETLATSLIKPLQVKIGPDGILYTLEYAATFHSTDGQTAIKRWEYTGPACAGPVTSLAKVPMAGQKAGSLLNFGFGAQRFVTVPAGAKAVRLYDLHGKLAFSRAADGDRLDVPGILGSGVYRVQFEY